MTSVLDGYLVDSKISLLDKTRIQSQVLVPVLRALRVELGKDKADAIVKQALRDWSKQLFAAIGEGIEGSPRRKWATIQSVWGEVSGQEVEFEAAGHEIVRKAQDKYLDLGADLKSGRSAAIALPLRVRN